MLTVPFLSVPLCASPPLSGLIRSPLAVGLWDAGGLSICRLPYREEVATPSHDVGLS